MDKALQDEIAAWLRSLRESGAAARTFALDRAPDVVREVVVYGRAVHSLTVLAAILVVVVVLIANRHIWRQDWAYWTLAGDREARPDVAIPTFFFSALVIGVAVLVFGLHIDLCLQAWLAPKLYVIHYFAAMLKDIR